MGLEPTVSGLRSRCIASMLRQRMAGRVGFEPTVTEFKARRLTTCQSPNNLTHLTNKTYLSEPKCSTFFKQVKDTSLQFGLGRSLYPKDTRRRVNDQHLPLTTKSLLNGVVCASFHPTIPNPQNAV